MAIIKEGPLLEAMKWHHARAPAFIYRQKPNVRLQMTGLIGPHSPWNWKFIRPLERTAAR